MFRIMMVLLALALPAQAQAAKVAYVMGGLGCPLLQPIAVVADDLRRKGYVVHLGCYFDGPRFFAAAKADRKRGRTVVVTGHSMGAWAVGWMSARFGTKGVHWIGLDPLYTGATTTNCSVSNIWEGGYPMGGCAKNTHISGVGHIFFPWDPRVRTFVLRHSP